MALRLVAALILALALPAQAEGAVVMPDLVTRGEVYARLHEYVPAAAPLLTDFDRAVLLRLAADYAVTLGAAPPVSKRKPVGALRTIVPAPASPLVAS